MRCGGSRASHSTSDFLDTLALNYGAGMYLVDFQTNPEGARKDINDWVSRETEEKIKDIVPQGAIDAHDPPGIGQCHLLQG